MRSSSRLPYGDYADLDDWTRWPKKKLGRVDIVSSYEVKVSGTSMVLDHEIVPLFTSLIAIDRRCKAVHQELTTIHV